MRLQYSLKTVLSGTALVALCLGSFLWLDRIHAINPSSERVLVLGRASQVAWRNGEWKPGQSGVYFVAEQVTPLHGWSDKESQRVNETLISIAYDDSFANLTYEAKIELNGIRSEGWNEFVVTSVGVGGGNVDGATRGQLLWNANTKIIRIELTQYFKL